MYIIYIYTYICIYQRSFIFHQGDTWNCTLLLDSIVDAPGTLIADKATEQVDVSTGMATFRNVTSSTPGSYVIKVHITSSSGSYYIVKRSVLRAIMSQLKLVVKKSVQLTFAVDFGLISGKHEFFQATLENHFYKIHSNNQVIFSNFKFKQGMWLFVFGSILHVLVSSIFNPL